MVILENQVSTYVVVTSFFSRILLKIGNEKASKASLFDHEIQKITLT